MSDHRHHSSVHSSLRDKGVNIRGMNTEIQKKKRSMKEQKPCLLDTCIDKKNLRENMQRGSSKRRDYHNDHYFQRERQKQIKYEKYKEMKELVEKGSKFIDGEK